MILTVATAADLADVLALINGARARLHARGIDQWPNEFGESKIGPLIKRGEVLLVRDGSCPAGTVTVSSDGDADFWTPRELAEPASYVSGAATAEGYRGLGELLLRWITDAAGQRLDWWVRLDARRDNGLLHAYYLQRGWRHKRTEEVPGRHSGALFERLALPDLTGRTAFETDVTLTARPRGPVLPSVPEPGPDDVLASLVRHAD